MTGAVNTIMRGRVLTAEVVPVCHKISVYTFNVINILVFA